MVSCDKTEKLKLYNDRDFQGIWRNTIDTEDGSFVEDLIITTDNTLNYTLTNSKNLIIYDKQKGELKIGNENKILWNCIAPITNMSIQTNWDVLKLSTYQLMLYSNLLGEHDYRRVYYSFSEDYEVQDTLSELFRYKEYLPLSKEDLIKKFGAHNRLSNDNKIEYLLNHPMFEKIRFNENYNNDSIYSYTILLKDWNKTDSVICAHYTKIKDNNFTSTFCDAESLEKSNNIILIDSATRQITISTLKDYDYWPDISHFLGMTLQDVKKEYADRYIYKFHEFTETGQSEYTFQTELDGIFSFIKFTTDSHGIIISCGMQLYNFFKEKIEAQKKETEIDSVLRRRYYSKEKDEKNDIYYYYSDSTITESKFRITLSLKFEPLGYYILIYYDKI